MARHYVGKTYGTAHAVQLDNLTNLFALCLQTESWICEVAGTVTSQPAWSTVNARQHGEPSTGVVNHSWTLEKRHQIQRPNSRRLKSQNESAQNESAKWLRELHKLTSRRLKMREKRAWKMLTQGDSGTYASTGSMFANYLCQFVLSFSRALNQWIIIL